jgi:hypothetical protein
MQSLTGLREQKKAQQLPFSFAALQPTTNSKQVMIAYHADSQVAGELLQSYNPPAQFHIRSFVRSGAVRLSLKERLGQRARLRKYENEGGNFRTDPKFLLG